MGKLDVWVVIGISIFFLLGGYFFWVGARNVMRALASSHWPRTTGVVVRSKTSASVERNRSDHTSTTMYSAEISIRYSVNGREYTTGNRHLGQTFGSGDSSDAELLHYRYPEGARVQVFYNPRDPSMAAAEPGFHMEALWLPGAGLAFVIPAIMFLLLYYGATRGNGLMAVGAAIFAGIFCTIGILFLSASSVNLWRARASQSWPQTTGVIVYGAVDESTAVTRTSDGDAMRSTVSGAHLVFSYEVNGAKHYSNIRRFGQLAGESGDAASRIAARYPLGKEVTVAYSPENPNLGVLETGIANEALWFPGAGLAFLLFGLAVFFIIVPAMKNDF